jgi:hypothetical protein
MPKSSIAITVSEVQAISCSFSTDNPPHIPKKSRLPATCSFYPQQAGGRSAARLSLKNLIPGNTGFNKILACQSVVGFPKAIIIFCKHIKAIETSPLTLYRFKITIVVGGLHYFADSMALTNDRHN